MRTYQSDEGLEFNNDKTAMQNAQIELWRMLQLQCCYQVFYRSEFEQQAVNTAVYVLNQIGPSGVDRKTPFETFTNKVTPTQATHFRYLVLRLTKDILFLQNGILTKLFYLI